MNLHFLSFLLDLFVWIVGGVLIGRKIYFFDTDKRRSKIKTQIIYATISVSTGLFAVLCNGLPESGFAFKDLVYVLFAVFVYVLATSSRFRKLLFGIYNKLISNYPLRNSRQKGITLINTT